MCSSGADNQGAFIFFIIFEYIVNSLFPYKENDYSCNEITQHKMYLMENAPPMTQSALTHIISYHIIGTNFTLSLFYLSF